MCGRYQYDSNDSLLAYFVDKLPIDQQSSLQGEIIYPGKDVLLLGLDISRQVRVGKARWGFNGFKQGQLLINARSESVLDKPTFAKAFKHHRCIFPMSAFYEWSADKTRYLFNSQDVLYVGGCYQVTANGVQAILLTRQADPVVASVHHRMPYCINRQDIRPWLSDLHFASSYQNPQCDIFKSIDRPAPLSSLQTLNLHN